MSFSDRLRLSAATIAAMRAAADAYILPRYQKLTDGDVRSKSHPDDLVTIADIECEQALARILPLVLPGSCVVGEEAASTDAAVLDQLAGDAPVWVVDPIDGTTNFVDGIARFATIIALVQEGETLMGWIHDPVARQTLWAGKGAGAWIEASDGDGPRRLRLPTLAGEDFANMTAALYHRQMDGLKGRFARVVRLGSAAHDYWWLADGRMQVLSVGRLKPWDHAAGLLIHTEAGGYSRLLTGKAYSPAEPDQTGILCAPSQVIWDRLRTVQNMADKA